MFPYDAKILGIHQYFHETPRFQAYAYMSGFRWKGIASLLGVSQVTLFWSGSVPNSCGFVPRRLFFAAQQRIAIT